MKFCQKCGKQIMDEAVICTNCGCSVSQITVPEEDNVSVGLCILAFLIPMFGVIYWPVKHKETPKRARACGITAIISWVLGIIMSIIFSAAVSSVMFAELL